MPCRRNAAARHGPVARRGIAPINVVIINVALPALTLTQMQALRPDPALLLLVALPWLMFVAGVAFFHLVGRTLRLPPATSGALMLCGGLANTLFVGLPMILAFYGPENLPVGMLMDQLGTYLVLNTLGLAVAALHMPMPDADASLHRCIGRAARRMATYPPFIALLAGLCLTPLGLPGWLHEVLHRLGDMVVPLALLSIGAQLRIAGLGGIARPLIAGLGFKLLLAPLLLTVLLAGVLGQGGRTMQVALFETAMRPQVGASIVALQHGLDARVVTAQGHSVLITWCRGPAAGRS